MPTLFCPHCQQKILEKNINKKESLAWCEPCDITFPIPQKKVVPQRVSDTDVSKLHVQDVPEEKIQENISQRKEVAATTVVKPLPKRVQIHKEEQDLLLKVQWDAGASQGCLFLLVSGIGLVGIIFWIFGWYFFSPIVIGILGGLLGINIIWAVFQSLNTTSIYIDKWDFNIKHHPFSFLAKQHQLNPEHIAQLFIKENEDDEYVLFAVLQSETQIKLLPKSNDKETLLFIQKEIEQFLRI